MSQVINYHGLEISRERIADFCHRWQITEFAPFGSVLRNDFRPDSDIDLLVDVDAGRTLLDVIGLEQDLHEILGRRVEVLTEKGLSPYLQQRILAEATSL